MYSISIDSLDDLVLVFLICGNAVIYDNKTDKKALFLISFQIKVFTQNYFMVNLDNSFALEGKSPTISIRKPSLINEDKKKSRILPSKASSKNPQSDQAIKPAFSIESFSKHFQVYPSILQFFLCLNHTSYYFFCVPEITRDNVYRV